MTWGFIRLKLTVLKKDIHSHFANTTLNGSKQELIMPPSRWKATFITTALPSHACLSSPRSNYIQTRQKNVEPTVKKQHTNKIHLL